VLKESARAEDRPSDPSAKTPTGGVGCFGRSLAHVGDGAVAIQVLGVVERRTIVRRFKLLDLLQDRCLLLGGRGHTTIRAVDGSQEVVDQRVGSSHSAKLLRRRRQERFGTAQHQCYGEHDCTNSS